ncbi:hypothetical protein LguiA_003813 [Lonicera macranthoides]
MTKLPSPTNQWSEVARLERERQRETPSACNFSPFERESSKRISNQMLSTLKLQVSNPAFRSIRDQGVTGVTSSRSPFYFRPARRRFASLSLQPDDNAASSSSRPSVSSNFTATVGSSSSPPSLQWNLTLRHIHMLNLIACAAAISATWLFCSAIPTLLFKPELSVVPDLAFRNYYDVDFEDLDERKRKAFKRAAESMEKLLDVTREELPDTMAAVRLSGMEISDLTMELSDLGQEITQGVKSSTRAVRLAEERLRRLTNMAPSAMVQDVVPMETKTAGPVLARTARGIREGIVKGRSILQIFFTFTRFSRMALNYFSSRAKSEIQKGKDSAQDKSGCR